MLLKMEKFHSLWLSSFSLYMSTTSSLFVHLLMVIQIASLSLQLFALL